MTFGIPIKSKLIQALLTLKRLGWQVLFGLPVYTDAKSALENPNVNVALVLSFPELLNMINGHDDCEGIALNPEKRVRLSQKDKSNT